MNSKVFIYDTTLRDGSQAEGITLPKVINCGSQNVWIVSA